MARKITMFELHFDGARFGPSFGSESEEEGESVDVESDYDDEYDSSEDESGGSKLKPLLAVAGVVLLVTAARRIAKRRRSEGDYGIEIDEESESVAAEQ